MDISVLIAVIGVVVSSATFYIGRRTAAKQEGDQSGRETGTILTEIGYIKSGIDDIKTEQRAQAGINTELYTRLATVEASAKQAHKRIDRVDDTLKLDRRQSDD